MVLQFIEITGEIMNCPICEKKMKVVKEPYFYAGTKFGEFEAEKCISCNEVFFTEESSDKIDKKANELAFKSK